MLAAKDFKDYRLKVYGLVENPIELSLDDLKAMGVKRQTTLHHCIQGWSGIAEWGGLPMTELMRLVRPKSSARAVVFYSFGEGLEEANTTTVTRLRISATRRACSPTK